MERLNKKQLMNICKVLIKQNKNGGKKAKKYKCINKNFKMYNEISEEKINCKNVKLNQVKRKIDIDLIKIIKINI